MQAFKHERFNMVERQLKGQGITDPRVLEAMSRVPRHRFVAPELWDDAYAPRAVGIACGQTISQPYMVATMTESLALQGHERVLEIGTGSGYQAAILGLLCAEVVSIERFEPLAQGAATVLAELGLDNVRVFVGDGSCGWPEGAPYDRIMVTAASPKVPPSLLAQLGDPGLLVVPVGDRALQQLRTITREGGQERVHESCPCRFVPLVGEEGFPGET